jgi:ABC-type transport system substrate-binding protein
MQMGLDLETISTTYWKGYASATPQGMVGAQGFYIPFDEWPEEVKKGYMYDPEGAEKLLDEAGYPRGPDGIRFKTRLQILQGTQDLGYAEIAASYWAEIGVDVEIDVFEDWTAYHEGLFSGTYEGMMGSIAGAIYNPLMSVSGYRSDAQWNRPLHQWPELDALVDAALAATTIEEQQRLIAEADMYMIEKHWQIWGGKPAVYYLAQPWLIGYNGELDVWGDPLGFNLLFARLWIDSELKEAMGR